MASKVVEEMMEEEPKIELTSMIDVVFLLIIFFILLPFKSYEKKIDSDLPTDEGMSTSQETEEKVDLMIRLRPVQDDPNGCVIHGQTTVGVQVMDTIPWMPSGNPDKMLSSPEMWATLVQQVRDYLGSTSLELKTIVLDPDPRLPFEFVALALDSLHRAQEGMDWEPKPITFAAPQA